MKCQALLSLEDKLKELVLSAAIFVWFFKDKLKKSENEIVIILRYISVTFPKLSIWELCIVFLYHIFPAVFKFYSLRSSSAFAFAYVCFLFFLVYHGEMK